MLSLLGFMDWEPTLLRVRESLFKVRQDLALMAVGEAGKNMAQSKLRELLGRR